MTAQAPRAARVDRTELDPTSFLTRAAYVYPDKVAVVHEDGRRYTYRELAGRSWRLATALQRRGLGRHERVATLLPNCPAAIEAHFGVPAAGGVLVTVNTRLSTEEIGYILAHSGSRTLLVDRELEPLVASLDLSGIDVVRVDDSGEPDDQYEAFLREGVAERPPSLLEDEDEPISVNYTSGTTGRPKGVLFSYRGAYLNAVNVALAAGLSPASSFLWLQPLFHCNGWCFAWGLTAVGGRHVTLRKVDPERIWQLIDAEGITNLNGAPTVQLMILNHPSAHRVERPVTVVVAAAPPSPTLFARMEELNFRVVHAYGLTETYGPTTACHEQDGWADLPADERARLLARQGQAMPLSDLVRVVDEEMADVPRDGATMGEVVFRGNIVMQGYFEDAEATAEAFRGGWFHSGDMAVWHPDGTVELRDRSKDIIVSGGENISSIEVEQVIAAHPAVLECAVVAVPHEHWGERPKAFVTLRDGTTATSEEIVAFTRERLAKFKCPDAVEFGPLPKTSTGKIQKVQLREREWHGRETRVGAA